MVAEKLNEYINNYLERDQTQSAIMLTGGWGTGKSYYIKNKLIPFMKDEDKCVCISLYGTKSLSEISKSLYMEIRAKALTVKSEKFSMGKIVAKTIIKGVTSFFGINFNIEQKDLENLYSSIDLTGKLVILEDLERSSIDIVEIMGYVNNLVEQDGIKVLLVANENEILEYKTLSNNEGDKNDQKIVLTDKSLRYLKIKEKTVSDTINFYCDREEALKDILNSFDNVYFRKCLEEISESGEVEIIKDIVQLMNEIDSFNLRTIIYACQKTHEIFASLDKEVGFGFFKQVFLGIIAFTLRFKQNDKLLWVNDIQSPGELGTARFPLFKFAYDYIKFQLSDTEIITHSEQDYEEQKELEKYESIVNYELNVLYNYYRKSEESVTNAVKNIKAYLKDGDKIPKSEYIKLSNFLIAVRPVIGDPKLIDECKDMILCNIKKDKHTFNYSFLEGISFQTQFQIDEFKLFAEQIISTVRNNQETIFLDCYSIDKIEEFLNLIGSDHNNFISERSFIKRLDIDKLIELISQCNSDQIYKIRASFGSIYGASNIKEFLSDEKPLINDLIKGIKDLKSKGNIKDKIILLQLDYFINELNRIAAKL